ncbi:MAG: hypothetical protein J0L55_08030 [Caulobacterales bacterium]|nr:hypothetical protein [Caulobacterales bacterium]MCA0373844.1 hypothetical protein [Pseudomonadota bacterium]
MGLEANILCHRDDGTYEIKAHLESRELILRGGLKMRILIKDILNPKIDDDILEFEYKDEKYRLELGVLSQKWYQKIISPPKSLAQKFGLKNDSKIYLLNDFSCDEVNLAIQNYQIQNLENALIIFAQIKTIDDLEFIHKKIAPIKSNFAIWLIYPKGKSAILK